jgi:hypothetical protein
MVGADVPKLAQEIYVTMAITVSTEVITAQLLAEVAVLYATEKYKKSLWDWQFCPRFGREVLCIVARDGDRIVGFNATMPIKISAESNQVMDAIWSCDFIVAPAYRGKGVGQSIKDEMAKVFKMPIMSLGISDSAFPLLLKKGWRSPARIDVWDLLNNPKTLKQIVLFSWSRVCRAYLSLTTRRIQQKYFVKELYQLPQHTAIQHLWRLHRAHSNDTEVVRNYDYLKWRYVDCPFKVYRFLHVGSATKGAQALVVFRITPSNSLIVVDFIGSKNTELISAACSFLLRCYASVSAIHWNTSVSALHPGLIANGFVKKSYGSRFATLSDEGAGRWGLVAGDSDGDFLRVAKEQFSISTVVEDIFSENPVVSPTGYAPLVGLPGKPIYYCPEGFIYRQINEQEFYGMESAWCQLMDRADANPLFMSWRWMVGWWQQWGNYLQLNLSVFLVFEGDSLVGILPFYQYKKTLLENYQFIGNAWGISPTVRSEYISPVFDRQKLEVLYKSLQAYILSHPCNTSFIFPDTPTNQMPRLNYWQHRMDFGYRNPVSGNFEQYLSTLGRMTRLKAFNRRNYLEEHYSNVEFSLLKPESTQLDDFFNHLNTFHLLRWGKPCFEQGAVEFHKQLLQGPLGKNAFLSYLIVDGLVVSASYNIQVGDVIYNVQSGYLEDFDKKISLGTLHMGWLIELAFKNTEVNYFDFLAGFGRAEDYKKHYRGDVTEFYTLQYFSSQLIGNLYCSRFWLKLRIKKMMNLISRLIR